MSAKSVESQKSISSAFKRFVKKGENKGSNSSSSSSSSGSSNRFWGKSGKNVPGSIKQASGSQYPPWHGSAPGAAAAAPSNPSVSLASRITGTGSNSVTSADSIHISMRDERSNSAGAAPDLRQSTQSVDLRGVRESATAPMGVERGSTGNGTAKELQFEACLNADVVDLDKLRQLCWSGAPSKSRAQTWMLLLGYLPTNRERRESSLRRKRREYSEAVPQYFDIPDEERTDEEQKTLHQILVDLPRSSVDVPLFYQEPVQRCLERILYIWAIKHPASGYVQGILDLVVPVFVVLLSEHVEDVRSADASSIETEVMATVEADCYWCITRLLDSIQDHYTFNQPGLHRMMFRMGELLHRVDERIYQHMSEEGLQIAHFAFRWVNCLLVRELPLPATIRLWDTCIAEENGFEVFHVYVCVAFLQHFAPKLQQLPFQDMLIFLQELPTNSWDSADLEPIISQAYILSTLFHNSPNHLMQ